MYKSKINITLCCFLFPAILLAQEKLPAGYDTIKVAGKSYIILNDSSIYIEKDTVLIVKDSIANLYKRDTVTAKDKQILDTLKKKVSKRTLLEKVVDAIVDWPDEGEDKQSYGAELAVNPYKEYAGKKIDSIIIKQLDLFGTDINDTTQQDSAWFKRTANQLHINTQRKVILNNILFKQGETVNPLEMSDSERLLRTLSFIKDARIIIENSDKDKDHVKVIIITKDIWSIGVSGSLSGFDAARLTFTDKNFLGLGHSLRARFIADAQHNPVFGFSGIYRITNFRHTFINGEVFFARTEDLDQTGLKIQRDFIIPETKYAGSLEIKQERILTERILQDTIRQTFPLAYRYYDAWVGRALLLNNMDGRSNLTFALRTSHIHYSDRPLVDIDTNRIYTNATSVLASVTLSKRVYHTGHLIYGYGVTEDIPSGYKATLTFGKDFNEFNRRDYLSLSFAKGNYIGRYGYLRGELGLGGFFNGHNFEQGLLRTEFNYFSHLYRIKKYYIRQFINLEFARGMNRNGEDVINISDEYGIRGIRNTELIGNQKLIFSTETVAFTPYYFLGFRFAFFIFADLGLVGYDKAFLEGKLYQGYGLGFRLRNENLTFTTFQIRFGFYPVAPLGVSNFQVDFDKRPRLYIEDFAPHAPSILQITPAE